MTFAIWLATIDRSSCSTPQREIISEAKKYLKKNDGSGKGFQKAFRKDHPQGTPLRTLYEVMVGRWEASSGQECETDGD